MAGVLHQSGNRASLQVVELDDAQVTIDKIIAFVVNPASLAVKYSFGDMQASGLRSIQGLLDACHNPVYEKIHVVDTNPGLIRQPAAQGFTP